MPLIDCPDCKHPVSDRAAFCPHCGCPSEFFGAPPPPEPAPESSPPPAVTPDFKPFKVATTWVMLCSVGAVIVDLIGVSTGDNAVRAQGLLFTLGAQILGYSVLHGRLWGSLPFDHRAVDPLPAVVRCLIPIYNYFWFKTAYVGLTEDLNAELIRQGLGARASPGIARMYVWVYYYLAPGFALLPVLGASTSGWVHLGVDVLALLSLVLYLRDTTAAAAWLRGLAAVTRAP